MRTRKRQILLTGEYITDVWCPTCKCWVNPARLDFSYKKSVDGRVKDIPVADFRCPSCGHSLCSQEIKSAR